MLELSFCRFLRVINQNTRAWDVFILCSLSFFS